MNLRLSQNLQAPENDHSSSKSNPVSGMRLFKNFWVDGVAQASQA
jgi:hypothetical protein